ncbi:3-ketosteroid-delta-1-dehydrogenase [Mycobacterium sp. ACS4054]|uniref:FAD-binding protein n=1 Tax=Mycobacterium sp. ACS4054 TaxID=1834119 RepID=UPI0007FDB12E|nr:FAD-binding protein [Mycobacterium sp. ACS4054]OBF03998.1 3-ketosteroid-delta-1-dehydrogenase [Mycobacterium sp. ACS4054]
MTGAADGFDHVVDVLVVGSGGGGMTAALTANAAGLDALVVEKSSYFGGSTALSGGGIWVPGAPAQRREGYAPAPEGVVEYLRRITDGLVSEARIRQYVESAPMMLALLERLSGWCEFVWKPGYADYYPELPGGSELGSTINVPPIDLRALGPDERRLLRPLALAPKGIWLGPKELRAFYRIRQSWAGKGVLLKLIARMVRARVFGERMAAIGQSLAARLRLTMTERGIPLWLDSPMTELLTDADGAVTGAAVERNGIQQRIGARCGVILASGGFDHDLAWRKELLPVVDQDWSFGNPAAMGDGIRAAQKLGAATDLLDEAWWFPAIQWPDGRMQFMLNERMMPAQFIVNGDGKRFINEAAPYMDFGHAMIDGHQSGVTHIPCWLITDHRSWNRYVIGGHLPIPKIPGAPVPTGRKVPRAWLESGVVKAAGTWEEMAAAIGVPAANLAETARRFNELARTGHDDDFRRGDSVYDNYYGDPTLPNPNLHPLGDPPYYAFRIVLGDLGTSGGLRTDEYARVLTDDDSVLPGLYAVGNTSAPVMGRSYAGAGATIGPAMTFGFVAANHIAAHAANRTLNSHRR